MKTKERPILFTAPMVQAILDGRKTQRRRPLKIKLCGGKKHNIDFTDDKEWAIARAGECPYGQIGDELWVRETWGTDKQVDDVKPSELSKGEPTYYPATNHVIEVACKMMTLGKKRPSIFMPRWASRIQLKITDIRVERLQDISDEDAYSEGIKKGMRGGGVIETEKHRLQSNSAKLTFQMLWEEINGQYSWNNNPWVWVIEFERIKL